MRSKIIRLLLTTLCILSLLLFPSCNALNTVLDPIIFDQTDDESWEIPDTYDNCYGWKILDNYDKSRSLKYLYDKLYHAIENYDELIELDYLHFPLTKSEVTTAVDIFFCDHSEFFWANGYKYSMNKGFDDRIHSISLNYLIPKSELTAAKETFEKGIQTFLSDLPNDADEYTLELLLHDKVAKAATYGESEHSHSAFGLFSGNSIVCEGYARAYQCLLSRVGIENYIVTGIGKNETHGWNLVKIGNKYTYVDVTWDDAEENYVSHCYFNITTEELLCDHTITSDNAQLPECTDTTLNYMKRTGKYLQKPYSVSDIAPLFDENNCLTVLLESSEDVDEYTQFIQDHYTELLDAAGISGYNSGEFTIIAREVHLELKHVDI